MLCSGRQGLFRFRGDEYDNYMTDDTENLLANQTYCAWEDRSGRLWAGTAAGLREAVNGRLVRPVAPDPVIDVPVYAFLEDAEGRVWYGTERGVLRRDGDETAFFGMGEGLLGSDVNRDALQLDSHGRVWIGTEGGVSRYDHRLDLPKLEPPRVELVALEAAGELRPLDAPFDLGVGQGSFTVHYAGLSFVDEARLKFRTRLEGVDDLWSEPHVSPLRQERFSNLSHGSYRFHVQAVGPDGQLSDIASSPPLVIRPYFWQRGWVRVMMILSAALMLWILVSALNGQRYTQRLRREVRARTRDLAASEDLLRHESERLVAVLEHISDGVMTLDGERAVILCNPSCERITRLGSERMRGRPLAEVLPEVAIWLDSSPADELRTSPEMMVQTSGAGELWLELAAASMPDPDSESGGVVLVLRDVTRRRQDRHERVRAQRLESLGVLAGGIAHDFNNLLMAIIGNASLLSEECDLDEAGLESVRGVLTAGQRAQQLTGSLLTFARGGTPARRRLALADVVRDAMELVSGGGAVRMEADLPDGLPHVMADPAQLGQVVSNLLLNARQAMTGDGAIRIRARRIDGPLEGLDGVRFVRLRIEDDGPGLEPEIIDRIFEPYFSTKETGSGLGLAIVYSVVQRHGGAIHVESPPGGGAVFEIDLPALSAHDEPDDDGEGAGREAAAPPVSRVLVLDDDASVREVIRRHLIASGVAVVSAPGASEALSIFDHEAKAGRSFDAVILDMILPGGPGGPEVFAELQAFDPDVVGIVISGYTDDPVMTDPGHHGFAAALAKPFGREELMAALEQALRPA